MLLYYTSFIKTSNDDGNIIMPKCECRICKLYVLRTKALESDDIEFVKETLKQFSDLWMNADEDASYYKCIIDGSWPTAKEILSKSLKKIHEQENLATKKAMIEIAEQGQWDYFNCENRCRHCARYQWEDKHEDDCPLGELLKTIEETY